MQGSNEPNEFQRVKGARDVELSCDIHVDDRQLVRGLLRLRW